MSNKTDGLYQAKELQCTQKCREALAVNQGPKGRARQYCLLLLNGDRISTGLSQRLKDKVDVFQLINGKYVIQVEEGGNTVSPVNTIAEMQINKPKAVSHKPATVNNKAIDKLAELATSNTEVEPKNWNNGFLNSRTRTSEQVLPSSTKDKENHPPETMQFQSQQPVVDRVLTTLPTELGRSDLLNDICPILQTVAGNF